ncbi:MAG: hypothetical protein KGQ59_09165 [Bdellovibrionales bacterium]|nr:hypothetical protein [Bdellovibrionales bacterium]
MQKFFLVIGFVFSGFIILSPEVRADLDVKLLMAGSSSSLSDAGSVSKPDGYGIGYGFLLMGQLNRDWNYEFGGLFLNRKTESGVFAARSSLMVPLLLNYRLYRGLKAELGGYWDYAMQSPPSGYQTSFYGALGGLSVDLPLIPGVGLVLGGHYLMQISSLQAGSTTTKFNDLLITAGFRLGETR